MFKFATGLFLGLSLSVAAAGVADQCGTFYDEKAGETVVHVPSSGVLRGYIVQNQDGVEICRNPMVANEFRGPDSYIYCDDI